jgi:Helix-turn-helix domain
MLAEHLRDLRERAPVRLTQSDLGQVFGDVDNPVSPAAISTWENPASGRLVPLARLDAYARLFCTPRSFEGAPRLLPDAELTADERGRLAELKKELVGLRDIAVGRQGAPATEVARSMWHFPDGSRITLVCSRLPEDRRPPSSDPDSLNYIRWSDLADLDALIDIYGAIRAYNPESEVVIMAAQDLARRDVATHLVLIGGLAWETVNTWFSRIFPIPVQAGDPAAGGAIMVDDPDGREHEFKYRLLNGTLVEDVGFFARGENPSAPRRTLTICGGITTRGVRGAARCFIDPEMRERNEEYLFPRFPDGSTYCVVMRVPVVNRDPLTPDLSKEANRLFEWSSLDGEAG